ncbi:MAG: DUF4249 domain-containing protein [Bacteroidota bacterium]
MKNLLYIFSFVLLVSSCEDVINPELPQADPIIVIDAWVNDQSVPQNIFVTRTQPYFQNDFPAKVPGATVFIEDERGVRYDFVENDTAYTWVPDPESPFTEFVVTSGVEYSLTVAIDGETFVSEMAAGRVPEIDSLKFSFNEEDAFVKEDYYTGEFVATDFPGSGDTYWIRTYKNGIELRKPDEINIAYDAGFSRGGNVDGVVFIQPIQDGVNPFDEDPENDNTFFAPYLVGDELYVEIHSISEPAFFFLNEVAIQTDRQGGFGALFAQPLANVSTNIVNADPNSDESVLGFFNVAMVSSRRAVLTEERAQAARDAE